MTLTSTTCHTEKRKTMREDKEVAIMAVSAVRGEGIWSYTQKQQENVVSFTLNFCSLLSAIETVYC
jgi:hypothetical protein